MPMPILLTSTSSRARFGLLRPMGAALALCCGLHQPASAQTFHNAFGHYSVTLSSAGTPFSPVTFSGGATGFGPGQTLSHDIWNVLRSSSDAFSATFTPDSGYRISSFFLGMDGMGWQTAPFTGWADATGAWAIDATGNYAGLAAYSDHWPSATCEWDPQCWQYQTTGVSGNFKLTRYYGHSGGSGGYGALLSEPVQLATLGPLSLSFNRQMRVNSVTWLSFGTVYADIGVTAVPEPSSVLLWLAGGLVLAGIGRRRRG